jgi:putative transposase
MGNVFEQEGNLSEYELLRWRVRYFSDGVVQGTKGFVNEIFEEFRGRYFQSNRREGARVMKGGGWGELYTVRDLRRETVRVPEVVSRIVS